MVHGYQEYISQLSKWCLSPAEHPLARTVFDYVKKGTLIHDLIQDGLIPVEIDRDGNHTIPIRWEGEGAAPEIYSVCDREKGPLGCNVRIRIILEGLNPEIWTEPTLHESAIAYNDLIRSTENTTDICYISGEETAPARIHPYAIGTSKLISSNDTTGFTYRYGMLDKPEHRYQISYKESQKIHLAFRWLREHQSFTIGEHTYLLWSTKHIMVPDFRFLSDSNYDDTESTDYDMEVNPEAVDLTGAEYHKGVRDFIRGYTNKLEPDEEVILMSVALPSTGRASITQYEPMQASSFYKNLLTWKESCIGLLPVKGGHALRSPSMNEIAHLAAGLQSGSHITNSVPADIARRAVLKTMVLGQNWPNNLIQSVYKNCVRNMTHRESSGNPLFDYGLNVAVAVIQSHLKAKGELPDLRNDRSYRFGQIFTYMYEIERFALFIRQQTPRATNAEKLIAQYCATPARTMRLLENRLYAYKKIINQTDKGKKMIQSLSHLISDLSAEDLTNSPLNEKFLIGYHSQLAAMYQLTKGKEEAHP